MVEQNFEDIKKAVQLLGLREKASLAEIKKAYRTLSKKWHPDKCKKNNRALCHEKMKNINWAYQIILTYVKNYHYSFVEDKVIEKEVAARWKKQFGDDPLWGTGEGWH